MERVLTAVAHGTHIAKDLAEHLLPAVLQCETFSCKKIDNENEHAHNKELVKHLLNKFIPPLLANFANHQTDKEQPFIRFTNKPLDRKLQTLS